MTIITRKGKRRHSETMHRSDHE